MSNSPNAPKTTAKKRSKAKSTAKKTAKPKAGKVANPDSRDLRSPESRDAFDGDVLSYVSKNGEVQSRAILDAIGGTMTQIRASLGRLIDKNLVDVLVVRVADRPLDQVAFLVDRRRGDRFQRQLADLLPEPHQVFVVALDLGLGPLGPRRADDQARAFRHLQLARDLFQLLAIHRVGDLAGNPAAPRRVRHQHAIAARQRQIGG